MANIDVTNINSAGELYLYRSGTDAKGYEKGYLMLPNLGKTFSTRERGHGYVSLRVGSYNMKHSIKGGKRQVKCLRPLEGAITTILIHDAYHDNPATLEGCIAPGTMTGGAFWADSEKAMDEIWQLLGGWEDGKEITLNVMNNVSYIPAEQTRDQWGRIN